MLVGGLGDLLQPPLLLAFVQNTVALIDLLARVDIEAVVVEERHRRLARVLHHGNGVLPAQPDHQRMRAGAPRLEAEALLVELAGLIELTRFERAVRKELELEGTHLTKAFPWRGGRLRRAPAA